MNIRKLAVAAAMVLIIQPSAYAGTAEAKKWVNQVDPDAERHRGIYRLFLTELEARDIEFGARSGQQDQAHTGQESADKKMQSCHGSLPESRDEQHVRQPRRHMARCYVLAT